MPATTHLRAHKPFIESLESRQLLAAVLPDLVPWADAGRGYLHGWTLDRTQQPGRTLLRLTSVAANVGAGPLELRGSTINPNGTQNVLQRIFNTEGGYTERLAGTLVYHPEHGHIHFDGFAKYDLRAITSTGGVGAVVAGGKKTSFCIADTVPYNTNLPGAPDSRSYATCTTVRQGLSVGWADVYDKSLPDQWVDVTNVPAGRYWLELTIDPGNRIDESNERNNVTRIQVSLGGTTPPPTGGIANSRYVGSLSATPRTVNDFVGASDTEDVYKFWAPYNGRFIANLSGLRADANLQLLDSSGRRLAESARGGTTSESLDIMLGRGAFFVRVARASGDTSYNLGLSLRSEVVSNPLAGARDLGTLSGVRTFTDFVGTGDAQDLYRFNISSTSRFASLLWQLNTNVNLQLLDSGGRVIGQSTNGGTAEERINRTLNPGTYYMRVLQVFGNTRYRFALATY